MAERRVPAWRPNFPALEDILGSTQAKILTDLLFDYAFKSSDNWQGPSYFSIDKETMYFRRTFSTILQYVSITKENLSKNIKALREKGLIYIQEKESIRDVYSYRVELSTHKYIKLAQEKLETVKDKYTRQRIEDFIDILSHHELILDALPIKKVTDTNEPQEPKSSQEQDLNIIVEYFKFYYKDIYNEDYNPNENEIKRLQKIMNNYSIKQLVEMIPIFIERYNERWKSSEYPYPTIFGLTQDWILKGLKAMCG